MTAAGSNPSRRRTAARLSLGGTILALCLAAPLGAAQADTLTETLADPCFDGAYRSYFDALAGYRPEDLRLELTETVEDALTGGSHLSRPKIDYKRRQIETALLRQARRDLCGSAPGPVQVKPACASAALAAAAEFEGFSPFEGNRFHAAARFHLVEFGRRPSFRDSTFDGPAEFLECKFATGEPPGKAASFTNVVFGGPVSFNNSLFHSRARFQSVLFAKDASFVNVRMPAGAVFRGCHFEGDAEFRFCRLGAADFGDRDNVTLFARRADFRGCEIESATFDYAELRG